MLIEAAPHWSRHAVRPAQALAVGSEARLAEFPDLPTVAETIPDFRAAG